jgi:serine/threonine-protein kinase
MGEHLILLGKAAGDASMEISNQPELTEAVPRDILPLIQRSGVLSDRQFEEVSAKVASGEYPTEARALAERLVAARILTKFQLDRLLENKTHGLVVGHYVILDRVGAGDRGRVFKAQHRLMDRLAAVKVIAPQIASRATSIPRFYREMRLMGRLDHPNVVRAFDADQVGDLLYIVMEYVAGRSLDHVLEDRGPLPAVEVLDYMAQAALGLGHAHECGIVHRDVKPHNLLLSDEGQIKLLDLGLSALMEADGAASFATAEGLIVGTLHYLSPEQAVLTSVDGRSDLFSLGCTMYHLLSGRVPFPGGTLADCLALRITGSPAPITDFRPDVSPRLVHLLETLMARRPEDRFQTAAEAARALRNLANDESSAISARRPTPQPVPEPPVPQCGASPDLSSAVDPSASHPSEPLVRVPSTWSDFVSGMAAQPPLFTVLIVLFELAVFALGFGAALLVR